MDWLNDETLEVKGKISFFRQDGTPLSVSINEGAASSEYVFALESAEILFLEVKSKGPNVPGWALIEVEEPDTDTSWGMMDGQEMFRGQRISATGFYTLTGDSGELLSRVGVLPSMYERGRYFNSELIALYGGRANTGVAIVNTSSETVSVGMKRSNSEGDEVASTTLSFKPGKQVAQFIDQMFEDKLPDGFSGVLEISSQQDGIVVMGLMMTQGILTSIPVHHFGAWQGPGPAN
jgi:hypothetical protein